MNGQIDQLVRSLLEKDSLDQCSLEELEQFASRHPYFGAAQLLLTKKLQVENSAQYDEQLQKTFLFFHNPLWVQQLLDDTGRANITVTARKEQDNEPAEIEQPVIETASEKTVVDEPTISTTVIPQETARETTEAAIAKEAAEEITVSMESAPVSGEEKSGPSQPVNEKEELLFEPFHTVDYFASQGIRIREEEKPTDKFGQQLRSFTDWLKSMKKLATTEIAIKAEPAAEKKVEQMAAHSLEEREVLTEAMAEVWEKQGNRDKAIHIYHKLSLLDPSKSAYFAAKIEELKKLN